VTPPLQIGAWTTAAVCAGITAILVVYTLITGGGKLRELYQQLARRSHDGRISANELFEILSFGAAGRRFAPIQLALIGSAMISTAVAKVVFGDHAVGVIAAFGILLAVVPYALAILISRCILQSQYPGGRDIAVDENDRAMSF